MDALNRRLTSNDLVAVADGSNQDRLQHTVLAQRIGERRDLGGIERAPRLERVGVNLVDGDMHELRRLEWKLDGLNPPLLGSLGCRQAATESSFVIHD